MLLEEIHKQWLNIPPLKKNIQRNALKFLKAGGKCRGCYLKVEGREKERWKDRKRG